MHACVYISIHLELLAVVRCKVGFLVRLAWSVFLFIARCLSFHPMAQCAVHALKGVLAAHVSLRLARLPRTASRAQRTCRLHSTHAAAPVLFVHGAVQKHDISFNGSNT